MNRWIRKFALAFRGLARGIAGEASFLVHLPAAAAVLAAAALARVAPWEWAALALAIGLVLAAELANTALERLARALAPARDPLIGEALDVGSAAVLVAAAAAAAVGTIVFFPRLWGALAAG